MLECPSLWLEAGLALRNAGQMQFKSHLTGFYLANVV
jgi:hypothetical protein